MSQNTENIYSPVKFANFVYICITRGIWRENGNFSACNANYTKFPNFVGLYFCILQHFSTKLCNSTNLRILFGGSLPITINMYGFAQVCTIFVAHNQFIQKCIICVYC